MARPAAAKAPEFRPKDHPATEELRQELILAFQRRDAIDRELRRLFEALADGAGSAGGAPADAEYLLCTADGALANARVLTAGTNVTFDDSTPGVRIVNAAGGGIAGIDVEDTDQSPTVATVTQLRFDAGDGIVVSSPGAGIARVDLSGVPVSVIADFDEEVQDAVGDMVANSATVSLTYSDVTPSLVAAVIAGSIGTTQLTDDGVTFAKLQNIATSRILGRDTAGSGNVEELTPVAPFHIGDAVGAGNIGFDEFGGEAWWANPTGGDALPVEVTPGPGLTWVGTQLEVYAPAANRVVYDVDFSSLANNTFANGTESIDGRNWTVANAGAASTFDIQNGTGIRWRPAASTAGTFSSTTQTAPLLWITLGSLIPDYDPVATYVFEFYVPTRTYDTGATTLYFALWNIAGQPTASGARVRGIGPRQEGAPTIILVTLAQTSTGLSGPDVVGHDTFGLRVDTGGITTGFSGVWAAGWPRMDSQKTVATAIGANDPIDRADTRLAISFNQISDASPTAAFDIARMRVKML